MEVHKTSKRLGFGALGLWVLDGGGGKDFEGLEVAYKRERGEGD